MSIADPTLMWSLLLLVIGLSCIVLEMFVPSAGMLGILATLSLITAVVMAFASNTWLGVTMTLGLTVLVPCLLALAVKFWPYTPMGRMVLLRRPESPEAVLPETEAYRSLKSLIGMQGVARSDMLPGGIVLVNGRSYDAIASGMPVDQGQVVKVVGLDTQRLVVRLDDHPPVALPRPATEVPPGVEDPFA